MSFEFPYKLLQFDDVSVPYPMVEVTLNTFLGNHPYAFIMDTGADITTLPNYMIGVLNINKSDLTKSSSVGIGGQAVSYNADIEITLGTMKFPIPATFVSNNQIPLLLGKEGIFDRFNITFDNDREKTIFFVR